MGPSAASGPLNGATSAMVSVDPEAAPVAAPLELELALLHAVNTATARATIPITGVVNFIVPPRLAI